MTSKTTNKYSPEVHARAVRLVLDHAAEQRRGAVEISVSAAHPRTLEHSSR